MLMFVVIVTPKTTINNRTFTSLAGLLGLSLLLLGCADEQVLTLRVGTYVPEKSVGVQNVMIPWLEGVQESVGSRIALRGYWGGSLGRDPFSQYELVKNGVLDVAWVLPGYTPGQFPQLEIVELPYLFATAEESAIALWRLHQAGLAEGFDDIHLIATWTTEPSGIHMAEPIDSLDDIRSKRIRTTGSVQAKFVQSTGAAPQTMAAVEMNDAIRRGTIDGLIQSWTGIRTFGTDQITSHVYQAPFGGIPFLLVMNKVRWDSLDPAVQQAVMEHGGENLARKAGRAYDRMGLRNRTEAQQDQGYGIVLPEDAENEANAKRFARIHTDWIAETHNGQAAYDAVQAILRELRSAESADHYQ